LELLFVLLFGDQRELSARARAVRSSGYNWLSLRALNNILNLKYFLLLDVLWILDIGLTVIGSYLGLFKLLKNVYYDILGQNPYMIFLSFLNIVALAMLGRARAEERKVL
jgi:hypothetical protein